MAETNNSKIKDVLKYFEDAFSLILEKAEKQSSITGFSSLFPYKPL